MAAQRQVTKPAEAQVAAPMPAPAQSDATQRSAAAGGNRARAEAGAGWEERLQDAEARLSRAERLARVGTWEYDPASDEVQLSKEILQILKLEPEDCRTTLGRFLSLVVEQDRDALRAGIQNALAHATPCEMESRFACRGGSVRFLRQCAEALPAERGIVRLVGAMQDITDYRQLEEQLRRAQRLESIGRLASGIAHDFNNLLLVIKGYSEMICSAFNPGDALSDNAQEIVKAADRAAALTRQLLAFSRPEGMRPQRVDLNRLIGDLENMLRRIIPEDIEINLLLDAALWAVKADPDEIAQVVINLVVNARDAMKKGGALTIATSNIEPGEAEVRGPVDLSAGPYVCLSISDTGIGMTAETRRHVFEPFFTTKAQGEGTGLGLSVVCGIVKQHGGDIGVYSEPGRGATFRVFLPATDVPDESASRGEGRFPLPRGRERILVVEDDESVCRLMVRILLRQGYEVLEAKQGDEAVELTKHRKRPIDLLLTDVVMPGFSGRELVRRVRALQPDIKVVFVSGHCQRTTAEHGVCDSDALFLRKPFDANSLGRIIRRALHSRKP